MFALIRRGAVLSAILVACTLVVGPLLLSCGGRGEEGATPEDGSAGPESVPGVTDTEIILGAHFPLSNSPAATYGVVADGMRAYFEYVNSEGGIYGRKIKFIVGDDHYSPPDAVEVVRKLVEQDGIFALAGGLGDPAHAAIIGYLEENGVPDLFFGSGIARFTDPLVKTRFAQTLDYMTESRMMANYLTANYNGKRMGILYQSDEGLTSEMEMVTELLKDSDIKIVSKQAYDFGQFDLTAQMQRMKNDSPDVVVLMANPGAAANAIKVSREVLGWDVPFIACAVSAVEITISLAGAQNAEGIVSITTGRMISETDDPGVQRHMEIMRQFAPNVEPSSLTEYGMGAAELTVQALKNAGPNLTRESVVKGAEQIRDFCGMLALAPANLSPTDHRPTETMWLERVENGKWVRFGDPVSYESTPGKVIACKDGEPVYANGQ
jgi:ABC-type branched-subunit amino acid transport system substrate-binding protein